MSGGVSIVIPALSDVAVLEKSLASLGDARIPRSSADEILVVDDSGADTLGPWLALHFPALRCVANATNEGFARALTVGVESARNELIFAMNSDVRVRAGVLEPLEAALADESVFAAVPRILLGGIEGEIESIVVVRLEDGIARGAQPALGRRKEARAPAQWSTCDGPTPFPIGGAFLFRRSLFRQLGGFDRDFEPFYLEDMDLGWRAWKAGFPCRYVPGSVVEHHHRGTIGALVPEQVVLTAIERNRLLFTWKHLDEPVLLEAHVRALARRVAEANVQEERSFLTALCLALEDRKLAATGGPLARSHAPTWERIQRASDPGQSNA